MRNMYLVFHALLAALEAGGRTLLMKSTRLQQEKSLNVESCSTLIEGVRMLLHTSTKLRISLGI